MIQFTCSHCGKTLRVQDQFAGKSGKCNGCGNDVAAPFPTSSPLVLANIDADLSPAFRAVPKNDPVAQDTLAPKISPAVTGCMTIVLIFCFLIGGCFWKAHKADVARNKRIEAAFSGRPDFTVSAYDLMALNDSNQYAAEKTYDDKVLEVNGVVLATHLTTWNQVLYLGSTLTESTIWCYFDESYNQRLAALSPGQPVTVRGVAQVGIGSVFLHRCQLHSAP